MNEMQYNEIENKVKMQRYADTVKIKQNVNGQNIFSYEGKIGYHIRIDIKETTIYKIIMTCCLIIGMLLGVIIYSSPKSVKDVATIMKYFGFKLLGFVTPISGKVMQNNRHIVYLTIISGLCCLICTIIVSNLVADIFENKNRRKVFLKIYIPTTLIIGWNIESFLYGLLIKIPIWFYAIAFVCTVGMSILLYFIICFLTCLLIYLVS
jgi:hypothetical protein